MAELLFIKQNNFHTSEHAGSAGTNMGKNAALQQARFTGVSSHMNIIHVVNGLFIHTSAIL